jgi:hypothetical protein
MTTKNSARRRVLTGPPLDDRGRVLADRALDQFVRRAELSQGIRQAQKALSKLDRECSHSFSELREHYDGQLST